MLDTALKVINMIHDYGYEAYIVGGFVRDYIIGIDSNDIDITTNATPKELVKIFPDCYLPNDDYGAVTVIYKNIRFEITTFRKEYNYSDNRRPGKIEYINELEPDLLRRDFTINTICIDWNSVIIDHLNGKKDISDKVIRSVLDADIKFKEDSLRILRAIRFATILDFKLDKEVITAIINNKSLLKNISYFRKKEELDKIFASGNVMVGIKMLIEYGLDKELELYNLDKVVDTSSTISIWSVLNVSDKYPFTTSEKELINNINVVLDLDNYDPYVLYKYGLYVNSIAADIKGLDKKKITFIYDNLAIKSRDDLDIDSYDIMKCLNREPGSYLKEIYDDIEKEIIYNKLDNNKDCIINYIIKNYK